MIGALRCGAVITVVIALTVWAPAAISVAVTPPAVDDSFLPASAPPSPPESTEQQGDCAVPTFDRSRTAATIQLRSIDLAGLWALSTGKGQTVAVIDTGVAAHPRLARLIPGGDYVGRGDGTADCDGHGTLVAGIIAATADVGVDNFAGIAPGVALITIRQSSGRFSPVGGQHAGVGTVDTLARAVRTAADMGATVINLSVVACDAAAALDDRALGAAVAYAVDVKDAVVVTAAGNVGDTGQCPAQNPPPDPRRVHEPDWNSVTVAVSPGWYDDYVLTVASVRPDGHTSEFSLSGPWVDVAATGEGVVSLSPTGRGLVNTYPTAGPTISGTSFAAPVVSGIVALVRAQFPDLSARQVMARIEATAHRQPGGWNPAVGNGIVDAAAALMDDPPAPVTEAPEASARPLDPPVAPADVADGKPRTIAFTGVVGCAVFVAAALALLGPAARLARRGSRDGADTVDTVVGE